MPPTRDHPDFGDLSDRLRCAQDASAELMAEVVDSTCRRFPSIGRSAKTERIQRFIGSEAWTDAALALIKLELPLWQIRRIAYDDGEWYCALSRQRELPDWLDRSVEAQHPDLALAILSAFVEVQSLSPPSSKPSVPSVSRDSSALLEPACRGYFG